MSIPQPVASRQAVWLVFPVPKIHLYAEYLDDVVHYDSPGSGSPSGDKVDELRALAGGAKLSVDVLPVVSQGCDRTSAISGKKASAMIDALATRLALWRGCASRPWRQGPMKQGHLAEQSVTGDLSGCHGKRRWNRVDRGHVSSHWVLILAFRAVDSARADPGVWSRPQSGRPSSSGRAGSRVVAPARRDVDLLRRVRAIIAFLESGATPR